MNFERRLSKSLKKLTLFFPLNPVLYYEQDFEKQKGPETIEQSLLKLQNTSCKVSLLVTLPNHV